jgi:hypothetical protein
MIPDDNTHRICHSEDIRYTKIAGKLSVTEIRAILLPVLPFDFLDSSRSCHWRQFCTKDSRKQKTYLSLKVQYFLREKANGVLLWKTIS